jgi:hypothetical protein
MERTMKTGIQLLMMLAGAGLILGTSSPVRAQQGNPPPASDNSKANRGDANQGATTADQQKMNAADRTTTQNIRSAINKPRARDTRDCIRPTVGQRTDSKRRVP